MLHTALTGISSASQQHSYWSENLSNKLVMSAVLLLFAALQSVLSPHGSQCIWWNFPSLHLLTEPNFYIGSGAQQASALLLSPPLPQAQQCQSCMKEALGAFCPMPVLHTQPRQAISWPPAHPSGNSSLLQCCRTSDLQHHYPELSGGIALLWK